MANILIDFEWSRCPMGYRLISSRSLVPVGFSPNLYPDEDWIVPNANEHVPCRPLEVDNLYDVFAQHKVARELVGFHKRIWDPNAASKYLMGRVRFHLFAAGESLP